MRARLFLLMAFLPLLAWPALADNDRVLLNAPGLLEKKQPKGLPDVKATPQAWPRLDPGAALCRSEDDLTRLAANRAHTEGGGPADCQIVQVPTAIQIMQRDAPGRTQVRFTERPSVVGWTDVWLPERAPNGR